MITPPCTNIPKLVRWRVKEWASCFYACRFPLDEDQPETFFCPSTQTSYGTMGCNPKGKSSSRYEKNKNVWMDNKYNQEKELMESSIDIKSAEIETEDSSWPRFSEEDYIVFCFRDDGAIQVLKDRKSEADSDHVNRANINSRPVNTKGEDKKRQTQLPPDEIKEVKNHIEEIIESKIVSAESSDSNQSEASTSSFAFPVLDLEWKGSPERMPKSEDLQQHLRKQSARGVLQCCRF